jgi:hypothetical protein
VGSGEYYERNLSKNMRIVKDDATVGDDEFYRSNLLENFRAALFIKEYGIVKADAKVGHKSVKEEKKEPEIDEFLKTYLQSIVVSSD